MSPPGAGSNEAAGTGLPAVADDMKLAGLEALMSIDAAAAAPVLCANPRLTRSLRLAHGRLQAAAGRRRWAALATATVGQWCTAVLRQALLAGELPVAQVPRLMLSAAQERLLWETVISEEMTPGAVDDDFYDRPGLAAAAAAANALVESWQLELPDDESMLAVEMRRFLVWRETFRRRCRKGGWLEPARALEWQIDMLARGAGRLPARVVLAGFDAAGTMEPPVARLARVLAARGVEVFELASTGIAPGQARTVALADRVIECRAAAAWAARHLDLHPDARIGIVVPELAALRTTLHDALDEYLDPAAFDPTRAAIADSARRHEFAVGTPLAHEPLVTVALEILVLAANPGRIEQARIGELLRNTFWSSEAETDARHRIEARMREQLPPEISLTRLLRFVRRIQGEGAAAGAIRAPRLAADLERIVRWRAGAGGWQPPAVWAGRFAALLAEVGWPGERPLSGHERGVCAAFAEVGDELAALDAMLGKIAPLDAVMRFSRLCVERLVAPVSARSPSVSVMGPFEPAAAPFDAIWVMGMNEHLWPPPARPNALLPAALQRRAGTPGASAEVQVALARATHERLLRSAAEVVFSWAQAEAGRVLRSSPLLAGIAATAHDRPDASSLMLPGRHRQFVRNDTAYTQRIEWRDDAKAPPVEAGERVKGGTALLKAQALCPAWAFYRFRLGAKALEAPVAGLDAAGRGTLLHAVLEAFWQDRGLHDLQAMSAAALARAIDAAVAQGVAAFAAGRDEPLPPRFLALEKERLGRLAGQWLAFEADRPMAFRVLACEAVSEIVIEGIAVRTVIDRIDQLDDGRLLILDYKTGTRVSIDGWAGARLTEPQLPIYASHLARMTGAPGGAGETPVTGVAGVALAHVRPDACDMVGIAAEDGLLPKVHGIGNDKMRRLFPDVADWPQLLAAWRENVAAIAREVGRGEAAVCFENAKALEWCEVKPLLRLAERSAQIEAQGGWQGATDDE